MDSHSRPDDSEEEDEESDASSPVEDKMSEILKAVEQPRVYTLKEVLQETKLSAEQVEETLEKLHSHKIFTPPELAALPIDDVANLKLKPKARAVLKELIPKLNGQFSVLSIVRPVFNVSVVIPVQHSHCMIVVHLTRGFDRKSLISSQTARQINSF